MFASRRSQHVQEASEVPDIGFNAGHELCVAMAQGPVARYLRGIAEKIRIRSAKDNVGDEYCRQSTAIVAAELSDEKLLATVEVSECKPLLVLIFQGAQPLLKAVEGWSKIRFEEK